MDSLERRSWFRVPSRVKSLWGRICDLGKIVIKDFTCQYDSYFYYLMPRYNKLPIFPIVAACRLDIRRLD